MGICFSNNIKLLIALIISAFINLSHLIIIAQQSDSTIFRTITLNEGKRVFLGQDITEIKDLCIKNDEGYSLKPGIFIRADSISIYVTDSNRIHTIHTYYDTETSFDKMEEVYKNYLKVKYDTLELSHHSAKAIYWQDDESVFAIVELHKDQGNVVFAILCDRKLYEDNLLVFNNYLATMKVSEDLTTSINIMNFILNQ